MKLGSLCSGAGGLDMAVEAVFGAETVWHCETDPAASKVLAARWPGVPNCGDLRYIDWTHVRHHHPVDILCAGWPCQPFSAAGKRKGAEDERAIWPHIADCVRVLRPRFVCLENVSAVLGPEFSRVANDLAEIGYDLSWTCLRASDIGAPHRRERLFVVAVADGATVGQPARGAFAEEAGAQSRNGSGDSGRERRPAGDGRRTAADSACDGWDEGWPESARLERGFDAAVSGAGLVELLPTPTSRDHKGQNQRGDDTCLAGALQQWGKYAPAIQRWEALTRPAPAPTEPDRNNKPRLNPAFSEWMMGWPGGWVTAVEVISRNDQLRIIGNGVVPQCAAAAFNSLLQIEAVA